MAIMTHAKFNFSRLMLTLIFGIRASEPSPRAWRTTEKAGPDRVKFLLLCLNKLMTTGYFAKSIFQETYILYNFMVSDLSDLLINPRRYA